MLSKVFTRQEQLVVCFLAAAIIVGAVVVWYDGSSSAAGPIDVRESRKIPARETPPPRKIEKPVSVKIAVDVVGEVILPGVYEFDKGARVIDALKRAGGITADADDTSINRAAYLVDGTQLVVSRKGDKPKPNSAYGINPGVAEDSAVHAGTTGHAPININTASQAQLETLKGIGPTYAAAIIEYRKAKPFKSIEELQEVRGIGPKKFAAIRDRIFVGGARER